MMIDLNGKPTGSDSHQIQAKEPKVNAKDKQRTFYVSSQTKQV